MHISAKFIASAAALIISAAMTACGVLSADASSATTSLSPSIASTPMPSSLQPSGVPRSFPPATSIDEYRAGRVLDGGRYARHVGEGDRTLKIEMSLPAQWEIGTAKRNEISFGPTGEGGPYLGFFIVMSVYIDPCHPEAGVTGGALGHAHAEDIADAFASMRDFDVFNRAAVRVGGHDGYRLRVSNEIDTATAACTDGPMLPLFVTVDGDVSNELRRRTEHSPATNGFTAQEIWVVDATTPGYPLVIVGESGTADPEAGAAAVENIVSSIVIK